MAETEKERKIREAYKREAGSMKQAFETLNEGKEKKDPTRISMEAIRKWFRNNRETLKAPTGSNSYVAPGPGHEIQVDMFHFYYKQPDRIKRKPKQPEYEPKIKVTRAEIRSLTRSPPYGILAVDVFIKRMHVVPLILNQGKDWRESKKEIVKALGVPKVLYTDRDSSLMGKEMTNWMNKKGIKHVVTRQHASFAERAIRYLNKRLSDELEKTKYEDGAPESYWIKHYKAAVDYYNKRNVQDTTNMKPDEAVKPENERDVKTNLEINARHQRKNPALEVGDVVRSSERTRPVRRSG